MRRLLAASLLILSVSISIHGNAYACETRVWDADVIKGLEGAVVVHAVAEQDCYKYVYTNYVGADRGMQGTPSENAWQQNECQRIGVLDSQNLFRNLWGINLDPKNVKVSCTGY